MNREIKSRPDTKKVNRVLVIDTGDLRLTKSDSDLAGQIKRAFDLAKSAGQELDLIFKAETA
jgi:hypothetical protein